MDISRTDQRILHLMAQGGRIEITRDDDRKIKNVSCFTRDGWLISRRRPRSLPQAEAAEGDQIVGRPALPDYRKGVEAGQITAGQQIIGPST